MLGQSYIKFAVITALSFGLAGCVENTGTKNNPGKSTSGSTRTVENDVEAPEVFQVTEEGLWDGRPSLGGVWVAHPTAKDPERVLIRNEANGKFVIGALFRKERETPGPKLQVSSDAADAIGMIAGAPVQMSVTALRREEITIEDPDESIEMVEVSDGEGVIAAEVTETALDPIASASAALDAVDSEVAPVIAAMPAATPKPALSSTKNTSKQSFLQLGIYSIEANANSTAEKMRGAGMIPTIKKQTSKGKTFWRVAVGPVGGKSEKDALQKSVTALGYSDAYYVSN
ncbi:SPOR domain-containing protein [Falsihalocynthiibacter sp. S25ZX9]|uniref:SPOR domain-containing protein n=1 Tax=Falsihalocynthiibacter sp. S25ZX9 TaxID=3240870 RepID=UPI00350FD792